MVVRTRAHASYEAGLTEAILPEDPTSADPRHIMTYNGCVAPRPTIPAGVCVRQKRER